MAKMKAEKIVRLSAGGDLALAKILAGIKNELEPLARGAKFACVWDLELSQAQYEKIKKRFDKMAGDF